MNEYMSEWLDLWVTGVVGFIPLEHFDFPPLQGI